MARKYLELVSTPAVLRAQELFHGRSRAVTGAPVTDPLGPRERAFVEARDSFYMATITESGWPYLQHRGGSPGFLRVLDSTTLAFADYEGNHQMISTGNLAANTRVSLFLMDYPSRRRLKLLGHGRVEDARSDLDLARSMALPSSDDPVERVFVIEVVSFDWNCPKYITPRFSAAEIGELVEPLHRKIAALEARLAGEPRTSSAQRR